MGNEDAIADYIHELLDDGVPQLDENATHVAHNRLATVADNPGAKDRVCNVADLDRRALNAIDGMDQGYDTRTQTKQVIVNVTGMALGIPAEQIQGLIERPEGWPQAMQSGVLMGLLTRQNTPIGIVHLANVVIPIAHKWLRQKIEPPKKILLLQGGYWGFAVDAVRSVLVMDRAAINWCHSRCQHCFLAGTAMGHRCALLDVAAVVRLCAGDGARLDAAASDMAPI